MSSTSSPGRRLSCFPSLEHILAEYSQHPLLLDELNHLIEAVTGLEIGELEGAFAAHLLRVVGHDLERGADHRRQVDLVDDEEIGLRDARPALARDLVARGDVD